MSHYLTFLGAVPFVILAGVWVNLWPRCVPRHDRPWPPPHKTTLWFGLIMVLPLLFIDAKIIALFAIPAAAIAGLDARRMLVPDAGVLLMIVGAVVGLWTQTLQHGLWDAVLGALLGSGAFAFIAVLFRHWRGRMGLGEGDILLMGALGLWLGYSALPVFWITASVAGLVLAGLRRQDRVPFAPCMIFAAWAMILARQMQLSVFTV